MARITKKTDIDIRKLVPYHKNAKSHSPKQIDKLADSIQEFGFISPVLIDKDYNIIAGHGRVMAAKKLKLEKIPCVFIDGLTDEQRRAYILADNRLAEFGKWDLDLVNEELAELEELDFDISAFEFPDIELDDGGYFGDERQRTIKSYNLDITEETEKSADFWQMPIIKNDGVIPEKLIGFNYAKTSKEKAGVHFFIDDYQFERLWNAPEKYVDILKRFDCVLSPDFSLYMEMPMPMKIWNVYRSRQIGAFYQSKGIKVIPTISWAEEETFCFAFEGIPEGSAVAVSTIGVKKSAMDIWTAGVDAMIDRIHPEAVLVYGGDIGYQFPMKAVYYDNEVTKQWKSRKSK